MSAAKSIPQPCFIDTNIWLYAFIDTQDTSKHALARQIIRDNEVIISTQVINEVCVNLLKKTDFSELDIRALVASFYGNYTVIEANQEILVSASTLREKYSLSYWDSLIVAAALFADCKFLYSEDMRDGLQVDNTLTIQNPFRSEK